MSVNNVINKWRRRFVLHSLHPPPRMKDPPLMTPRVSPLNHVDLPVSMHSFPLPHPLLPTPPLHPQTRLMGSSRGRGSLSCPLLNT